METNRTLNSRRNIYTAIAANLIAVLLGFINRTLIIYRFGIEYVGVSGLFSSIISVLNFTELGFSSAIVMSMYEPLSKGDTLRVNALLAFYRKAYHIIGCVILVAGLIITPLLPWLVGEGGDTDVNINIYVLYLINLANTVISYYMFAYRSSMLEAAQRQDLTRISGVISNIIISLAQIIVAFTIRNFYLFTAIMIVGTVLSNLISAWFQKKYYPEYNASGILDISVKNKIYDQVKGIALIKAGEISRNSFDSIVISIYLGLKAVGMYSNYYYIYHGIFNGISIITSAIQASIGNSIVTDNVEKNYHDMMKFQLIFSAISVWAFNCMLLCYQPFMEVWTGKDNILPQTDMILFCVYFYIMSLTSVRNLYVNGVGLWWSLKYITIAEAAGNLILNFILGKIFGIGGVLAASIITMFFFNYLMINRRLFREYFIEGKGKYYKLIIGTTLVTAGTGCISYCIGSVLPFKGITAFIINLIIATVVSLAGFMTVFRKTELYSDAMMLVRKMLPLHK